MAQTLGIVDLLVNGRKIDTENGAASFQSGGLMQKKIVAGRKLHVAAEWMAGEVKCTTVLKAGQSLDGMYTVGVALEIQALCDTGQTFVWSGYQVGERPKATGGEGGKVELTWAVSEAQELVS